ncbi:hypothetical protein E0L36_00240 [Streptomyces sp. AJS327]|nr:hypothetical protein [Streptomyces sp. AJS327]
MPIAPPPSTARRDPRLTWTTADTAGTTPTPVLRRRRDGILPAIAAALSVRGETYTCTASRGDQPPTLHPLVQDFLDGLDAGTRERQTGRCPEALLLSRCLTTLENARPPKRGQRRGSARRPRRLGLNEARRALKQAKLTTRRIREDGDPLHGSYAPPCRSCTALLDHFGVRAVAPEGAGSDAGTPAGGYASAASAHAMAASATSPGAPTGAPAPAAPPGPSPRRAQQTQNLRRVRTPQRAQPAQPAQSVQRSAHAPLPQGDPASGTPDGPPGGRGGTGRGYAR